MATARSHRLAMENGLSQNNSFSFDQTFPNLADKVGMDEISDEFETWPDRIDKLMTALP